MMTSSNAVFLYFWAVPFAFMYCSYFLEHSVSDLDFGVSLCELLLLLIHLKYTFSRYKQLKITIFIGLLSFLVSDAPRVELQLGRSLNASSIKEGDDVYFECLIYSNPPPKKIVWTRQVSILLVPNSNYFMKN